MLNVEEDGEHLHVTGQGIDLERAILTKLTAMAGCRVITTGDGRISLTQRRTPGWTVVLAILTFPLGLLFLLFKVEHNLNVMITPDERGGSRIDLIGVTRQRTLDALTEALVIEHGADVEPLGVRL